MGTISSTSDYKKDSSSGLDAVIEKLERYCNYLQNQVNKKSSGAGSILQPEPASMADDATNGELDYDKKA